MPLLDHFRPPLSERRCRQSFLNMWATYISSQLNALLPAGYFAEANVQFGVEIDVAAFDEPGTGAAPASWTSPPPQASVLLELSGAGVEVGIFSRAGGPRQGRRLLRLLAGLRKRFHLLFQTGGADAVRECRFCV